MSTVHDFDTLEPAEVPFGKIAGKEYVVREPSEAGATAYEGARVKGGTLKEDKVFCLNDSLLESRAVLIGAMLAERGKAEPVGLEFAKRLKRSISSPAFDACLELYERCVEQTDGGQLKN